MKKILLLPLLFVAQFGLFAQKLYDNTVIHNIEIQFAFDDWKTKMDVATAVASDLYTVALWCKIDGEKYDSVGVKFKGNSSYKATNKKNPLHIALDFVKGKQEHKGTVDLKLSTGYSDPTFIREALSYSILSNYMDCPRTSFTNVYINGKKYGFYTNVESVSKRFMEDRFGYKDGVIVKCTPTTFGGGVAGATGFCTLKYLGKDSSLYTPKYDMKTVGGYKDFINFCDTLTNKPAAVEKVLDVNRALWMLAYNNLFINLDSYTGTFCQNYYLYKDKSNRFLPILWDLNMSFNGFPSIGGGQTGAKTDAFLGITNADRPLIKNLLSNLTYKKMYVAHINTMIDDWFANGKYLVEGAKLQAIADTAFNNDPNKIGTYANFKIALTQNVTGSGGSGIKPLMEARMAHYKTVSEFTKASPAIDSILPINATIEETFTLNVIAKGATALVFNYRTKTLEHFEKIKMYNDGTNGDLIANDSIWTLTFTPQVPDYQYYIWAENPNAGIFSPRQVEMRYHTFSAKAKNSIVAGAVVVNEIMANNKTIVKSPSGKFADWVEFYNTTNADVDLSNAGFSDNYSTPKKWLFPVGTKIKANDYLIVWADDADTGAGLHASFKLADNGERYLFTDAQGKVLDSLSFNNQKADYSFARCPNGTGNFVITNPTFGVTNGDCKKVNVGINDLIMNELVIYPNPTNDVLTIKNDNANLGKINIFDLNGKNIFTEKVENNELQLDMSNFANGMYILKTENSRVYKVVKQ